MGLESREHARSSVLVVEGGLLQWKPDHRPSGMVANTANSARKNCRVRVRGLDMGPWCPACRAYRPRLRPALVVHGEDQPRLGTRRGGHLRTPLHGTPHGLGGPPPVVRHPMHRAVFALAVSALSIPGTIKGLPLVRDPLSDTIRYDMGLYRSYWDNCILESCTVNRVYLREFPEERRTVWSAAGDTLLSRQSGSVGKPSAGPIGSTLVGNSPPFTERS